MPRRLIALPWMVLAVPCMAMPAIDVELQPQVAAPRADVRLGDVATVGAADPALRERLRRLWLGAMPAAGGATVLTRHDIERRLRASALWNGAQIRWSGSTTTQVQAPASAAASDAGPLAHAALLAWLAQWSPHATASPMPATEGAAPLPAGALELRVRPIAERQPAPRMRVWVDAWQGGRFVRALPFQFAVQAPAPALLARRALPAGSRPAAADFIEAEVDLATVALPLARLPAQAAGAALWAAVNKGLRLRRTLAPGMPLDAANSEPAPPVCGGDTVQLSLTAGHVVLASQARALQDGQLGQKVAVQRAGTTHPIMARVTGAGTVEVE